MRQILRKLHVPILSAILIGWLITSYLIAESAMRESNYIQNICLTSDKGNGAFYMSTYDSMPREIRDRLKYEKNNLCAACVSEYAPIRNGGNRYTIPMRCYHDTIEDMNKKIGD